MSCPRCNSKTEVVSEYYDFDDACMVRDVVCVKCNSVEVLHFYSDGSYSSEWISLNG
jgi:hypothetical protein